MILKIVTLVFLLSVFLTVKAAPSYKKYVKIAKANLCLNFHYNSLSGCTDMLEFDIVALTSEICVRNTTNCKKIRDTCVAVFLPTAEVLPEAQRLQADTATLALVDDVNTTATMDDSANTLVHVRNNKFF